VPVDAVVVDLHDVRALELGDGHGLALEPAPRAGRGEVVRAHQLERDATSQRGVEGRPDGAHTTPCQLALQGVLPPYGSPFHGLPARVAERRNHGQSTMPAAPER